MRRALLLLALSASGCGRLGFDEVSRVGADGALDGAPDGADAAAVLCAPANVPAGVTRLVCDDFETVASPWTAEFTLNGTWVVEGGVLLARTVPLAAGDTATVERSVSLSSMARRVRLAFDVFPEVVDTTDPVIAYFSFDDGSAFRHDVEYVFKVPPEMAYIEDVKTPYVGTPSYNFFPMTAPSPGSWHHIELAIDLDAPLLTSTLDGVEVLRTPPAVTLGGVTLNVAIGIPYVAGASATWQVKLDNVVLDTF